MTSLVTTRAVSKSLTWLLKKSTTVKPVLRGHSKEDSKICFTRQNPKMHVKSIAECSGGAFCNTFDLH